MFIAVIIGQFAGAALDPFNWVLMALCAVFTRHHLAWWYSAAAVAVFVIVGGIFTTRYWLDAGIPHVPFGAFGFHAWTKTVLALAAIAMVRVMARSRTNVL